MEQDKDFDVIHPGPELPDGGRVAVRCRPDKLEIGSIRPAVDGQPIPPGSELVRLVPKDGEQGYAVESIYKHGEGGSKSGPAMVNSREYVENWGQIRWSQTTGTA